MKHPSPLGVRGLSTLLILCLLLPVLVSCRAGSKGKKKVYYTYFDTVTEICSYRAESDGDFSENADAAAELLGTYHKLFDIYHEYEGVTNLATINRLAGGEPVAADEKLIDFLLFAKEMYGATDGYVNVMMGSVLTLWHDFRERVSDGDASVLPPTEEELAAARAHTAIDALRIDRDAKTVCITDKDASLDVGAMAKGYAAARAAELLRARGADSYVINAGGNLVILGAHPDGTPFSTVIRNPRGDGYAATVSLADTSFVTSGDYERYVTLNGVRYHHIIDKDTLAPATRFSSVSVMASDSGVGDALSTALFCMPYEAGRALAERFGAEVLWITPEGEILRTEGMK